MESPKNPERVQQIMTNDTLPLKFATTRSIREPLGCILSTDPEAA